MWHFDTVALIQPGNRELALLAVALAHLDSYAGNYEQTRKLMTPDGSRNIIDTAQKFLELIRLRNEVDALAQDVAQEVSPYFAGDARRKLREAVI